MATWHQQNAWVRVPYWHETKWTVVEDAPDVPTCLSRFDDQLQAHAYLNNLTRCGRSKGAYIVPPMQASMRRV